MLSLTRKLQPFPLLPKTCYFSTISSSPNFMTQYLITSLGFSPEKATTIASKKISHITSPTKPDSVRHFLKHVAGLSNPQIRTLVTKYPPILCIDTQRNMEPNLLYLRKTGLFAKNELCNLIIHNPQVLQLTSAMKHFEFWAEFFQGDVKRLKLTFKRNRNLIGQKIDTLVGPKIALLKEYDLSDKAIRTCFACSSILGISTASIELLLKRVEEFGFLRGSPMFHFGILALIGLSDDTLKAKMDLYKSYGWSDEEIKRGVHWIILLLAHL